MPKDCQKLVCKISFSIGLVLKLLSNIKERKFRNSLFNYSELEFGVYHIFSENGNTFFNFYFLLYFGKIPYKIS